MNKKYIISVLFITSSLLTGCWTSKSGHKVGVLVKVAKEGRYWGTYEGELIRGGLNDASGVTGRAFHFTLGQFKSDLVTKAELAMENNQQIILTYHCEEFVAPWRGETKCFADKIQIDSRHQKASTNETAAEEKTPKN